MLINEEKVLVGETGLFFEDKEALNKALNVLKEVGINFKKESVSVAFANNEAHKIAYDFNNKLKENGFEETNQLSSSDLEVIASSVLADSTSIDNFIDELRVAVTNETLFNRLYT